MYESSGRLRSTSRGLGKAVGSRETTIRSTRTRPPGGTVSVAVPSGIEAAPVAPDLGT
jgi:hypothetical protein